MWSNLLAAIVLYTFDLSILFKGYAAEENFYFRLNKVLQKRDAGDIQKCTEYLHYLMKGLEALPAYTPEDRKQGFLWRGVNSLGRSDLLLNYKQGRQVYWRGFSSATPKREVALHFAKSSGPGGVLLRLALLPSLSRSRDIRSLSALRAEDEVLLFPNFGSMVTRGLYVDEDRDGFETIDILEQDMSSDVFEF